MELVQLVQHLQKVLKARREHIMDVLESNGLTSMEHYRHLMGELDGLNFASQELKDFLDKRERLND